ncbi:MAG: hypothetical protein KC425_02455 [Anaerolineales bacterium]|nr:hypothetical protein [Anaerolineales bacterium]
MSDTQWPRYEVFKQDTPNKPHEAVGSVHAADAEMALLNARDVFGRRPKAVSMWVAPATAVFSLTAEEMAANPAWHAPAGPAAAPQPFHLFAKTSQRRSMTFVSHVGSVTAVSAVSAVQQAIGAGLAGEAEVFVWWAIPDAAITRSDPDAAASLFDPALDKTYRQQSHYGFVGPRRRKKT